MRDGLTPPLPVTLQLCIFNTHVSLAFLMRQGYSRSLIGLRGLVHGLGYGLRGLVHGLGYGLRGLVHGLKVRVWVKGVSTWVKG
jgi:hypothetical protein